MLRTLVIADLKTRLQRVGLIRLELTTQAPISGLESILAAEAFILEPSIGAFGPARKSEPNAVRHRTAYRAFQIDLAEAAETELGVRFKIVGGARDRKHVR